MIAVIGAGIALAIVKPALLLLFVAGFIPVLVNSLLRKPSILQTLEVEPIAAMKSEAGSRGQAHHWHMPCLCKTELIHCSCPT